jgi:DNA polymerase III subunit delta
MPVYLLLGDDEDRKARSVEKLRRGRAVEAYEAAETSPDAVVSACNSRSLFGDGSFVLVRNLDAWTAAQKARVLEYLQNPSPETDLVMLGKKLGAREKLLAAVKRTGEVHDFKQPTGAALAKWAVGHAKKLGLELPEDVAGELVARCSDDKVRVIGEIEKLALYAEGTATLEDLEALVRPDLQTNIFRFVDALGTGDRSEALEMLEALLATGESPLRIVYMVRRQFRLLSRARSLFKEGTPRTEVASLLKVPPFVAMKLEDQAGRTEEGDLERALDLTLDLEGGLKGRSALADELQVELAVLKLT